MKNYCNGSHHQYLSHECFKYLSEKLDKHELSQDNKKHFDNALTSLGKDQYTKFFENNIINNLAARVGSDGVFWHADTKTACNYINYKLNESLRNHYNHRDIKDYTIFKDFVKVFYNKRQGNFNDDRSCEKYIEYMDNDIYNRVLTIFRMYYYYNELKNSNKYIHDDTHNKLCSNLYSLIHYSNYAINQKILNDESIKLVKKLKQIMENDNANEPYRMFCDLRFLYSMLTEFPTPRDQITKEASSALDSQVPPKTDKLHELDPQRGDTENEQASIQLEIEDKTAMEIAAHVLAPQEAVAHELPPQEPTDKVEEPGIQLNSFHAVMHPVIGRQVPNDQDIRGQFEGRHISQHPQAPTDGREGLLGKMQGFFTDTLGQVEPAPILGVSGGMGALFLLFKYTPFGTFFRGRGRVRRIPSGFHGQFPGGFPGYEEYDVGHIGYGPMNPLAE
ncbi:hypothetical protein PVC01_000128000 [Plasmodium vivax]|uniref:VIR protein n=1 Tax=Plasmodium vivax TaxID=5855 RepID=A0A1G4E8K5_PLAVI|nr:hypothetical protein PVC01_000128000 [Plasmodium vivax]